MKNKSSILDDDELRAKRAKEDQLLNTTSVSAWRKNKILQERKKRGDDDLTIRY